MTVQVLKELRKYGRALPRRAHPVPVVFPELGQVGSVSGAHGLYLNSALERHTRMLLREHYRIERLCRDLSGGRLGADEALAFMRPRTDIRDVVRAAREGVRAIKSAMCAVTSWDAIIAARAAGTYWDYLGTKSSQTTVASQWSSFLRTAGNPSAAAHDSNIPGGKRLTSATAGAWPLPMTLGGSDHLYLVNFGNHHATGANITLLIDGLVSAANISATSIVSQAVSSTALSRWTTGDGIAMTLEITTALGATAANITLSYTDQGGAAANSTGAIALTTSGIAGRLQPVQDGPQIRLASPDFGVRVIEGVILSASMAAGVLAAIVYKPLLLVPTLSTSFFVERSTPAQIGGIRQLTAAAGGEKPFLGFFVLSSTTSTGVQSYLMETVWSA